MKMNKIRTSTLIVFASLSTLNLACRSGQRNEPHKAAADSAFFPIMCWEAPAQRNPRFSDPRHGIESLRDCGFNTVGFATADQLPLCEKLGMKAIVTAATGRIKWNELSDEEIETKVRALIDSAGNSRVVIGYYLVDEPGAEQFEALGKAVAAVKWQAPGKIAYINLYPDYATIGAPELSQLGTATYAEYLARFVNEVHPQLISYDNYRVLISNDLADAEKSASYYQNLLAIRDIAQKHDLPFWNIASSNQIRPFTPVPSPANLLFQAYTTLAAGGRGMTWFRYYVGRYHYAPIDDAGNRTEVWSYLKMVNDQLKIVGPQMLKLQSTGVYFTAPPPADGLAALPGEVIASVQSPAPVMIGEFQDSAGARYAMIVNLSLDRSAKCLITPLRKGAKLQRLSPADGIWSTIGDDNSLWLAAGQGMLLRVTD